MYVLIKGASEQRGELDPLWFARANALRASLSRPDHIASTFANRGIYGPGAGGS